MAIVDLSQLAAPDVVEEVDYETLLAERKATFVSLLGLEGAKSRAQALIDEAAAALLPYGDRASALIEAARFVISRQS